MRLLSVALRSVRGLLCGRSCTRSFISTMMGTPTFARPVADDGDRLVVQRPVVGQQIGTAGRDSRMNADFLAAFPLEGLLQALEREHTPE